MSTLNAEALVREFHYNRIRIPDPSPDLSVEQVRDLLTPNCLEIATASLSGPEATGTVFRYTFTLCFGVHRTPSSFVLVGGRHADHARG